MKQGKTDIERYTRLVQSLNNPTITDEVEHIEHERLLEYFTTWIAADYDLKKWSMREQFRARLFNMRPLLKEEGGRPIVTVVQFKGSYQQFRQFEEMYVPIHQEHEEAPEDLEEIKRDMLEEEAESRASDTFREFLQSPFYNAVAQCVTCDRFYLITTGHRGRKYCSQKCASKQTAMKATAERNRRIRSLKARAVQSAIAEFKRLPKSKAANIDEAEGWKSWVAKRANVRLRPAGCSVSVNFVTRTLNRGKALGKRYGQ
jgi:hypothetical protein